MRVIQNKPCWKREGLRQSILQALAEQSRIVRLPLNQVGSLNKINKAYSKLEQEFEREPTPEELAN
ncbi:sigma-70 domain-containing protein, partial [Aquidulcibacter sp.]|uniref:sigma-70 domain-containing protein n=1 Tax=Aquidulcibacter sp. TaxID=2052990 RepID=UPI00391807E3